jgi:hypothetical protein
MKLARRLVLAVALLVILICCVVLLNVTAPNPTGRRYSSQSPISTGQGNASQIGVSAEKILSADLRLPRNDEPEQRQCVCNAAGRVDPKACRVCMVNNANIDTYRRPDFVGSNFIAESKNARDVLYDSRDADQITDFVTAAKELGKPLWVFTRTNTNFPPELRDLVASTGGGVVPYFNVAGYVDPMDEAARYWLLRAGVVFAVLVGVEMLIIVGSRKPQEAPSQPVTTKIPMHPVTQARNSTEQAEQAMREQIERVRRKLD